MAYYKDLKTNFDNNKQYIKNVLNNLGCIYKLKDEGLLLLKYLLKKTLKKVNEKSGVDNAVYDHITLDKELLKNKLNIDDDELSNALRILKYYKLINVHETKGTYTGMISRSITLNLNKFNSFDLKGLVLVKRWEKQMSLS